MALSKQHKQADLSYSIIDILFIIAPPLTLELSSLELQMLLPISLYVYVLE